MDKYRIFTFLNHRTLEELRIFIIFKIITQKLRRNPRIPDLGRKRIRIWNPGLCWSRNEMQTLQLYTYITYSIRSDNPRAPFGAIFLFISEGLQWSNLKCLWGAWCSATKAPGTLITIFLLPFLLFIKKCNIWVWVSDYLMKSKRNPRPKVLLLITPGGITLLVGTLVAIAIKSGRFLTRASRRCATIVRIRAGVAGI